ncbi:hypothetical protein Ahy_A03g011301 [Arachis hypogaea]|uniref:PB1-like domain-containing protein n=1 Tax=Arachis hypogaea TaxID=3818 RepID=A0A445DQC9_ARAHY|nr:hypothetical protein Ahy_A03g011301 [Arachis hypogaea]
MFLFTKSVEKGTIVPARISRALTEIRRRHWSIRSRRRQSDYAKSSSEQSLVPILSSSTSRRSLPLKNRGMATIHKTLSIHHRGRFERGPCGKVSYISGEVTEIERVNVDTLNGFFMSDLLKDIGYTSISEFYWLEPGKEVDDGLRLLRVDMDVVRMYEAAMKNENKINVYTEHPVDQPVVVEEKELTQSKMRRKVCAKRVPTLKKTPKRRLAVVKDDDDVEIAAEPPSTQSQPSQPPLEANVSEPIAPEQLTQYIPHPYRNSLLQSIPKSAPLSDSNRTPQNNENNPSDEAEGRPKRNKRRSTKRPPPTGQSFIPNPDPDKPPTFFVLVD